VFQIGFVQVIVMLVLSNDHEDRASNWGGCSASISVVSVIIIIVNFGSISSTFYTPLFVQKCFEQLSLVAYQLCNFWRQNISAKCVHKMFMKLTLYLLWVLPCWWNWHFIFCGFCHLYKSNNLVCNVNKCWDFKVCCIFEVNCLVTANINYQYEMETTCIKELGNTGWLYFFTNLRIVRFDICAAIFYLQGFLL